MAEWLVEEGIGEQRAVRIDDGRIVAARMQWPGTIPAGAVVEALVTHRFPGTHHALVRLPDGTEAHARRLPKADSEGTTVRVVVEREAMAERGRLKRAQATRTELAANPWPTLADSLQSEGHSVRIVHRFPDEADWEELFAEAWSGEVPFHGGTLLFADTPAMTLVDVDGYPVEAVSMNAIPALAGALRRFDLAGNIGIDFPTLTDKADRQAVDHALAEALAGWPHERTSMNGFGFVQIIARLTRTSIQRRVSLSRVGAAARIALRRAERVDGPGVTLLTAHPALKAKLKPEWLAELERRTGRPLRLEADPGLALEAACAQIVPHEH
ncbi:MAG: ribonuclease [Erythrobacter sp. 34-65-8]|nr:MAG: ribonuclease [Erythrobacter sp. 34-65-8]